MAASMSEQVEAAKALLPANGEMLYQDWQAKMYEQRLFAAAAAGHGMKKHGVNFRLEVTPTSKKLFVSKGG